MNIQIPILDKKIILPLVGLSEETSKKKYLEFDDFFEENEISPYDCHHLYFFDGFKEGYNDFLPNVKSMATQKIMEAYYEEFDSNYLDYLKMYPECQQDENCIDTDNPFSSLLYLFWECGYMYGILQKRIENIWK